MSSRHRRAGHLDAVRVRAETGLVVNESPETGQRLSMRKKAAAASPSTINRTAPASHPDLSRYYPDLAAFVDGVGQRSVNRRETCRLLLAVP